MTKEQSQRYLELSRKLARDFLNGDEGREFADLDDLADVDERQQSIDATKDEIQKILADD